MPYRFPALILSASLFLSLPTFAREVSPCTRGKIGSVVGTVDKGYAVALARITANGRLERAMPKEKLPCEIPPLKAGEETDPEAPEVSLAAPLKLVGLQGNARHEVTVGAIGKSLCGDSYRFCPNRKSCDLSAFTDDLFFTEAPGQKMRNLKLGEGRGSALTEKTWAALEEAARKTVRTRYSCGYGIYKGTPGKVVFRQIREIPLQKNKVLRFVILGVESTKNILLDPPNNEYPEDGRHTVVVTKFVREQKIEPADGLAFCGDGSKPEENSELKSVVAVEYGKYAFVKTVGYTDYTLWSVDQDGHVAGHLDVSNGQAECD